MVQKISLTASKAVFYSKIDIIFEKFYYEIILLFSKGGEKNERNKKSKWRKFLENRQNAIRYNWCGTK
ncbi:MAG: hypothetical protein AUJ24_00435 [Parcubacteria group bacterium CG1_02_36_42]|nr:MAG: hypothetical protein AUJ24_00435 [Parcubacteria group bacterium CG1_02_36_42]